MNVIFVMYKIILSKCDGVVCVFKIYVFSEMDGVVVDKGVPVGGAVLTRTADFNGNKEYTDSVVTDKDGKFHFKAVSIRSLRPLMFDTSVFQNIVIKHNDKEIVAWSSFKRNDHHRGEVVSKSNSTMESIKCVCDLSDSEEKEQIITLSDYEKSGIMGVCTIQR